MPKRNPNKRYPYEIRGRVEMAVFNCPHCNALVRFRAKTAIRQRCRCGTTLYVTLHIHVLATSGGAVGRPPDTILPALRSHGAMLADRWHGQDKVDEYMSKAAEVADLTPDPVSTDERIIAELPDGAITGMPVVSLDTWLPGEAFHRLTIHDGADTDDDSES